MIASGVCALIALLKWWRQDKDSPNTTKYDEIHLCVGCLISAAENNLTIRNEDCLTCILEGC